MAKIDAPSSYAVWGTGEVDEGNAAALLDDYLPERIGAVYRPARVPRSNKSLSAVINWLESDDILGPKGTVPSDDLIASLLERQEGEIHDHIELIVLWPADPSDDDKEFVTKARDAGIRVVSLGDAIDDLAWEPEQPAGAPGEAAEVPAPTEEIVKEATAKVTVALGGDFGAILAGLLEQFVRGIVQDEIERKLTAGPSAEPPPFNGPYKPADTVFVAGPANAPADDDGTEKFAFYVNEDGRYRKAKARPRKGEQRVMLTQTEIDRLGQQGHISD